MSLCHPLLAECGLSHGFGTRSDVPPPGLRCPRQVHGVRVVTAEDCRTEPVPEADVVISGTPGAPIGVVTADCIPILAASRDRSTVLAIHAGWRGLAAGVIEAGVDALRRNAPGAALVAAIGPHVGPCHYEVDAPVVDALRKRFPEAIDAATSDSREDHWWLDLGHLAARALSECGIETFAIGRLAHACTACDAQRFESYRRDGARSGRLVHWIAAGEA